MPGWGLQEVDEPWRTDLESIYAKGKSASEITSGFAVILCIFLNYDFFLSWFGIPF